ATRCRPTAPRRTVPGRRPGQGGTYASAGGLRPPVHDRPPTPREPTMPLMLTLARGVLTGLGKHPDAEAPLPAEPATAPAVRVDPRRLAAYAEVCGFPPA